LRCSHRSDLRRAGGFSRLGHDPSPVPDAATRLRGKDGIKTCDADGRRKHSQNANADYPRECHLSLPFGERVPAHVPRYYDLQCGAMTKEADFRFKSQPPRRLRPVRGVDRALWTDGVKAGPSPFQSIGLSRYDVRSGPGPVMKRRSIPSILGVVAGWPLSVRPQQATMP
jgi:hypothetical protein